MGSKLCHILFYLLAALCSPRSTLDYPILQSSGDKWETMETQKPLYESEDVCQTIKPSARDIIKRIDAVLPYLDREHKNAHLLQIYRATINLMTEGGDMFDREVAFYASVLTPLVFLQPYKDAWCLLERFQYAIRRYQASTPVEKRTAMKPLQNLRDLNNKIRLFINNLPAKIPPSFSVLLDIKDEDRDKDGRFFNDVINNLD